LPKAWKKRLPGISKGVKAAWLPRRDYHERKRSKEAGVALSEQHPRRECWCGNLSLTPFSADYELCQTCGTVVAQAGLRNDAYLVHNDETDFYGKTYWLGHQAEELGLPRIEDRARLDLPQRCLYWLRHLLSYRRPSAKVLELGSAHGGFVALLRWAGFDATGLEMSPWVAELARHTFDVPMLVGPIEQQNYAPASFDIIVAHDVMEHLPDPVETLSQVVRLLKPDGILMIQMPEYPDGKSHAELEAGQNRFLEHTKEPHEHLYLYSKRAARLILSRLGLGQIEFLTPIFDYDMYFVASRGTLERREPEVVAEHLKARAASRLVLALLDKAVELDRTTDTLQISEGDRLARLAVINRL
jgi:SAM-dependent methyltransferase